MSLKTKFTSLRHALKLDSRTLKFLRKKFSPPRHLSKIDIHLSEHCNLNCFSCTHFSQIAEAKFPDIAIYEKDLQRLSQITNGNIDKIQLMGGEPLLNPDCKDFFAITRKYFPNSKIWLVTNGILLPKQEKEFWESARDNAIEIHPTKYPIKVDWNLIQQMCQDYGVPFEFFGNSGKKSKSLVRLVLNPKGDSSPLSSFISCTLRECAQLQDGKFFQCTFSAYIQHFNKRFNQNLEVTPKDYLDLYDPKITYQEILQFMLKPIPFCRYCKPTKWQHTENWKTSTKEIGDYIE